MVSIKTALQDSVLSPTLFGSGVSQTHEHWSVTPALICSLVSHSLLCKGSRCLAARLSPGLLNSRPVVVLSRSICPHAICPTLFLLFVNDLLNQDFSLIHSYAETTTL
ncbi:hypothetical protein E2C01_055856 [Portunus trituberculatus]|uniref:Uncharacterized protein n=1 Tax=Portunus trituberculatus TaxID=210409 RepID=A0A5B7GNL2_PORTR|nr:hypothetical protein [Portunus trituberculatus]